MNIHHNICSPGRALSLAAIALMCWLVSPPGALAEQTFIRADVKSDGTIDLTDVIVLLDYITGGDAPECLKAADADDDGSIVLTDAIFILDYLFRGQAPPPPPFPECGADDTPDGLSCGYFSICPVPAPLPERLALGLGKFSKVTFSPDGEKVMLGTNSGIVAILDGRTGEYITFLTAHDGEVIETSFSRDGERALTLGKEDWTVRVWDAESWELLLEISIPGREITSAAFTPDRSGILIGTEIFHAQLRDAGTGDVVREYQLDTGIITYNVVALAFSPGGELFLASSRGSTTYLVETDTGTIIREHSSQDLKKLLFSPDGKEYLIAKYKWIDFYDTETGERNGWTDEGGRAFDLTADGTALARVTNPKTGPVEILEYGTEERVLHSFPGQPDWIEDVAISPDGSRLIYAGASKTALLWEVEGGELIRSITGHQHEVGCAAFSPLGERIVTGSADTTIRTWEASSGRLLRTFRGHASPLRSVAFSPDGTRILSGSLDGTARIWGASSGKLLLVLEGHALGVLQAVFSPDGGRVATAGADGTARIWNASSGEELLVLRDQELGFTAVAFSPQGDRILTGSAGGAIRLWDVETGDLLRTYQGHQGFIRGLVFSPDGTRILSGSGDGTARIWNRGTGDTELILEGHTEWVSGASFSPDGTLVLTGSGDGTARVWSADTGETLQVIRTGGSGMVLGSAFSRDGTRVITTHSDSSVLLWPVEVGQN